MTCEICNGKRYFVSTCSDERQAVERCDACSTETLTDMDAAKVAQGHGIKCANTYPCVLH